MELTLNVIKELILLGQKHPNTIPVVTQKDNIIHISFDQETISVREEDFNENFYVKLLYKVAKEYTFDCRQEDREYGCTPNYNDLKCAFRSGAYWAWEHPKDLNGFTAKQIAQLLLERLDK